MAEEIQRLAKLQADEIKAEAEELKRKNERIKYSMNEVETEIDRKKR
jgi:peptidoglycan hydrolase CwlO-like protein